MDMNSVLGKLIATKADLCPVKHEICEQSAEMVKKNVIYAKLPD